MNEKNECPHPYPTESACIWVPEHGKPTTDEYGHQWCSSCGICVACGEASND